ncbi:MAG TPA: EamA family transporter [Candidatus Dormibacteraeota bacterium]|nr:EamA family transporter [Candidatus Dormibacteraeota bacterium]
MNERVKIVAAYAGMVLIWSTTWLAIKWGLAYMPPLQGVGLRYLIAGLFVLAIARVAGARPPRGREAWRVVGVTSVALFGLNYALTYFAEEHISSGLTAVLFGTAPFWIMIFAYFLAGESLTARKVTGSLLALAGVAAISFAGTQHGTLVGVAEILAAALLAAFGNVYIKRHQEHAQPLVVIPPAMLISALTFGTLGWFLEPHDARAFAIPSLAALGYLSLFGSGIAFLLNYMLLRRLPASTVGLSGLMIPVVAVIIGVAGAGERFTLQDAMGAALVLAGIALALAGAKGGAGGRRRPPSVETAPANAG